MRNLGRLAMVAALVVSAGAVAPLSAGAVVDPTATCAGTSGSVALSPGLNLVNDHDVVQSASVTAAGVTCTGGYVTAGALKVSLKSKKAVSCNSLIDGIPTKTPKWNGTVRVNWNLPVGMGRSDAVVQAYVLSTTGASTTFKVSGNVLDSSNLFYGHFSGKITINKGLNSTANGGSCSVLNAITSATVTASNFKVGVGV